MQTKSQIGKQGEQIAMEYLRRQGFLIADVNWRSGRYEIDIVAQKGGMIHFVDEKADFENIMNGPFIAYVRELKAAGIIHHIGMSTHNPAIVKLAAESGEIEMVLFSVNPAFDMLPASENIGDLFAEKFDENLAFNNIWG